MNFLNSIVDESPNISVITKIEVLRFNTSDDTYKILKNFVNDCTIFDLTESIVDVTISICKFHRIKLPDAIIAATASVYDLSLITRNLADFSNISGLNLINPWDISG